MRSAHFGARKHPMTQDQLASLNRFQIKLATCLQLGGGCLQIHLLDIKRSAISANRNITCNRYAIRGSFRPRLLVEW